VNATKRFRARLHEVTQQWLRELVAEVVAAHAPPTTRLSPRKAKRRRPKQAPQRDPLVSVPSPSNESAKPEPVAPLLPLSPPGPSVGKAEVIPAPAPTLHPSNVAPAQPEPKRRYNFRDITSQTFGAWTVVREAPSDGQGTRWECRHTCGATRILHGIQLRHSPPRSCAACTPRTRVVQPQPAGAPRSPLVAAGRGRTAEQLREIGQRAGAASKASRALTKALGPLPKLSTSDDELEQWCREQLGAGISGSVPLSALEDPEPTAPVVRHDEEE
jgi:hypothetical protein